MHFSCCALHLDYQLKSWHILASQDGAANLNLLWFSVEIVSQFYTPRPLHQVHFWTLECFLHTKYHVVCKSPGLRPDYFGGRMSCTGEEVRYEKYCLEMILRCSLTCFLEVVQLCNAKNCKLGEEGLCTLLNWQVGPLSSQAVAFLLWQSLWWSAYIVWMFLFLNYYEESKVDKLI